MVGNVFKTVKTVLESIRDHKISKHIRKHPSSLGGTTCFLWFIFKIILRHRDHSIKPQSGGSEVSFYLGQWRQIRGLIRSVYLLRCVVCTQEKLEYFHISSS